MPAFSCSIQIQWSKPAQPWLISCLVYICCCCWKAAKLTNQNANHQTCAKLQSAVTAYYFPAVCVCNMQYGLLTITTDLGRHLKWWPFTFTSTELAHRLYCSYCTGSCWWEAGEGGKLCWNSCSASWLQTQLLISVCMGLYRPEVRIQYSKLSYTAPLPAPKPVNPSHLVSNGHPAYNQWSPGDT